MRSFLFLTLIVAALRVAAGGCLSEPAKVPAPSSAAAAGPQPPAGDGSLAKLDQVAYPHLHNLLRVSQTIYSGGEPHGEAAFAELARLGVKTIVSVDGARPEVETAAKYGLRYVHIPIGYDGVPEEAGESFAQLMRTADGPFFIHCHHGKHRGPAGAAAACIAAGERTGREALQILELAGTSKDYPGLWRDVEGYAPPPADAELPPLVSVAEVGSLATAMARIDRHGDNLKLLAANDWQPVADHPDLAPAQEALLVKEGLVEAGRHLAEDYDRQFRDWMEESALAAGEMEASLNQNDLTAAGEHFGSLRKSCKQCHDAYRN